MQTKRNGFFPHCLLGRKYEDLKRYVQGVNCVTVGEIGLDHVRARRGKIKVVISRQRLSTGERG